jgi:hypothetical protein
MLSLRRLAVFLVASPLVAATLITASAHAEDAKQKSGGQSYIELPALTATILRANGRRGALTVETGVDVPSDPALRRRAEASEPRLRAAFLLVLQAYASGLGPGAPPDADYIARILQREADRTLGRSGARLLVGTILVN